MPQARHPAASPLPKVPSPRAPAVADFRSPMPRAAVVDSRSRTQPVSAALPPVRSRTRPRWRSPRVTREPEPAVPEPVVALEVLAPAAVVAPVVPELVAMAVQVVPERAVRVPAAVALPVAVRPAVAQRAQPGLVVPEPVA